ncbi:hypothetical protein [[Limnothrix rosea] IAM M-220]|uniref:hypothetical protein n=1 Tax=[Limnothrix rosea] IAM M-220 TaxID=454133 RepID=UPI001115A810|nr:hypothetical protein [[Limnothrix rosea] IAM M-220]
MQLPSSNKHLDRQNSPIHSIPEIKDKSTKKNSIKNNLPTETNPKKPVISSIPRKKQPHTNKSSRETNHKKYIKKKNIPTLFIQKKLSLSRSIYLCFAR